MSRAGDLTADARVGYDGNANPHLATSPRWYAHKVGEMLHATGRPVPHGVRMGRGSKMHANGMLFEYRGTYWERIR